MACTDSLTSFWHLSITRNRRARETHSSSDDDFILFLQGFDMDTLRWCVSGSQYKPLFFFILRFEPSPSSMFLSFNNGYNGGWPSASRLFGWSAADWSWPATNKSISSERKRKSLLFCWERESWTSWLLTCCSKKGWAAEKSSKKV